ncbi:MAG: transketolase [Candidatus Thermoplasmatota archaeon]|jgi:transketolase|nr:transketolase [Candidatus Thermoplasmatota archaeon]
MKKSYDDATINKLNLMAVKIRKHIIEMLYRAKSGHPGGSLSAVDAIVALYFFHMRQNPKKPCDPDRDRFILSKGHAAPALYAVLAESGYFPVSELKRLREINCRLQGHPVCFDIPGVEASTGSLGHGLSFANGVALAGKLDKKDYHVYVMLGDGETDEGQVWEAAAVASHYRLDNLTAMIDRNFLQIDGNTEEVLRLESVRERWSAFGWYVVEVDGHDIKQILDALNETDAHKNQPSMIILNTVKGKGVSFMENNVDFHGVPPNEMEYHLAMKELDLLEKKLEAYT